MKLIRETSLQRNVYPFDWPTILSIFSIVQRNTGNPATAYAQYLRQGYIDEDEASYVRFRSFSPSFFPPFSSSPRILFSPPLSASSLTSKLPTPPRPQPSFKYVLPIFFEWKPRRERRRYSISRPINRLVSKYNK